MRLRFMQFLPGAMFAITLLTATGFNEIAIATEPGIVAADVAKALERGYAVIRTGVKNYPEHRDCFSCHHQTLPLLAFSLQGRRGLDDEPQELMESQFCKSILNFTEESFSSKNAMMRDGTGVGGRALTVGYGLWTMDLGAAPRNETSDAMVEYLLKTQAEDGSWSFQSLRPPAASSRAMTTAIAVYGLRAYAVDAIESARLTAALTKAEQWSLQYELDGTHEELIGSLWLDQMLSTELTASENRGRVKERLAERSNQLWVSQRGDGGWAQTSAMASDAYATGQALLMLTQLDSGGEIQSEARFRNGVRFLLNSQEADGSWHVVTRSKPVQVYFDNGDPHGKDQFISMMATSWSTAALANFQVSGRQPLESLQVAKRTRAQQAARDK